MLILRRVIMNGFPEVKRLRVRIGFAELSEGECLNYEVEGRRYRINVSPMLRRASRKALEGGIAHELSHILHDSRMGSYQFEQAMKRYAASMAYRTRDERVTDTRAIERGYGAHLLAFTLYAKNLGIVFRRENGLVPGEIVARLKAARGRKPR